MTENEIKKLAVEYLERNYPDAIIWVAPAFRKMRWDIFGVFDLILLCEGKAFFIQYTTLTNLSHRRNKINDFLSKINWNDNFGIVIMAWDKKKGVFKIEKLV